MNLLNKFNQSTTLDFGRIIDQSFNLFKKTYLVKGLAYFILIIISGSVLGIGFTAFGFSLGDVSELAGLANKLENDITLKALSNLTSLVFAAFLMPINAGILNINHLALNGKEFSLSNIFDYYKSKHLGSLIITALILSIIPIALDYIFVFLNIKIIGTILTILFYILIYFTTPLIIYENATPLQAIEFSFKLSIKHIGAVILLGILSYIIACLGVIALCIGLFFTLGYVETMRYSIYSNAMPIENSLKSSIDEIGTINE